MSEDRYKVATSKGRIYSRHGSMSDSIKHVKDVLEHRGIEPTVKNAMHHGFSLTKEHELPYWSKK